MQQSAHTTHTKDINLPHALEPVLVDKERIGVTAHSFGTAISYWVTLKCVQHEVWKSAKWLLSSQNSQEKMPGRVLTHWINWSHSHWAKWYQNPLSQYCWIYQTFAAWPVVHLLKSQLISQSSLRKSCSSGPAMCPGITSTSRSRTALEEHCLLAHDVSAGYQIAAQTEHSENRLSFKHQVVCFAFIFQHIFFIPDRPPFSSSFEVWVFPSRCSSVSCSFLHNIKHLWGLTLCHFRDMAYSSFSSNCRIHSEGDDRNSSQNDFQQAQIEWQAQA